MRFSSEADEMTPDLHPLPDPLPARLRWTHVHRRTTWLFDGTTCVGSLGFAGYGRASGLTSRGIWHVQRRGVLDLGVQIAPTDGRHPPLFMRQTRSFDGALELPDGTGVQWRTLGVADDAWVFERVGDGARLFTFRTAAALQAETLIDVEPPAAAVADPTPLLLLGAFLVRLAVDDSVVIAGG